MKTIKLFSIVFVACLSLQSCGGGDDSPSPTPTPTPTPTKGKFLTQQCNMPADASETTISLTGLTSQVTTKKDVGTASWVTTTLAPYSTVTPAVTINCTQNLETKARSHDVIFLASNDTLLLTIKQACYTSGTDVNNPNDTPTDQPAY